ncbi:hypothetical protein [Mesorhizobium japonicum]|nr:hypothetical protein [Mesorhizobium japonicum]
MDKDTMKQTSPKAPPAHQYCCDDADQCCGRNNYFVGKKLTSDSFRLEQRYMNERRRLLNRAVTGWGVVYGFPIQTVGKDVCASEVELGHLKIGEGLGLDKFGRELFQSKSTTLALDNLLVLDGGKLVRADGNDLNARILKLAPSVDACWLLSIHYAEQRLGPVTLRDSCSCERTEWDRICETVVYSLRRVACEECCVHQECALDCGCSTNWPCCNDRDAPSKEFVAKRDALDADRNRLKQQVGDDGGELQKVEFEYDRRMKELVEEELRKAGNEHTRGGCRCLCEHLTDLAIAGECPKLCEVDDCTKADLFHGLGLACLKLEQDNCGKWRIASIYDACGPRRLVKRNDLLFDLINGCDLTRISRVGWWPWHRRPKAIDFDSFALAFGYDGTGEIGDECVTRDFWVEFSRPVRAETLAADCFVMTVITGETEGGWWETFRVPIVGIDTQLVPPAPDDPPGYVRSARIVVAGGWLDDAVYGRHSMFVAGQTRVEIEVRGDFIEDCNAQTVDANARGRSPFPTGNGVPGDSYLSTFLVEQRTLPAPAPRVRASARAAEGATR